MAHSLDRPRHPNFEPLEWGLGLLVWVGKGRQQGGGMDDRTRRIVSSRARRRRRWDRLYRAAAETFFITFLLGMLGVMGFLVRMILPVL